ncbi:MAG TPA: zinc ribbon domain-containing protein, partial [Bacteroidota bacterium]|nr:zinc ribbon domain-containing protein [Bacteroidota bacterium]
MARAKLVCGDCLKEISPADEFCRSCGAPIERTTAEPHACPSCGHANPADADYCTSCGASLRQKSAAPAVSPPPPRKAQKAKPQTAGRRLDLWQIISVAAVILLLGCLVYLQVSSDHPSMPSSASASAPSVQSMPAGGGANPLVDLKPLEDAVKAEPADPSAVLRLANALHDNRMLPRAVDTYKRYLSMRPKDPDARTDLGICYFQMALADSLNSQKLFQQAAAEMEQAFSSKADHQPSAFNLGIVYLHMGNMAESNRWFSKA